MGWLGTSSSRKSGRRAGFTLLEMLIAVPIIAVLGQLRYARARDGLTQEQADKVVNGR